MTNKYLLKIAVGGLFLLGGIFICANFSYAAEIDNVYGWAWSDNIGWISFNCYNDFDGDDIMGNSMTDNCTGHDYGITIDEDTGVISGYAWSDNIGWISLNTADVSGCPAQAGESCQPEVELSGTNIGDVVGWAKALNSTGVDYGWINLQDLVNNRHKFSIDPVTGYFEDYAWGGGLVNEAVIGWISLSSTNYDVWTDPEIFNIPPYITDIGYIDPIEEDLCNDSGTYGLYWTFNDDDDDSWEETFEIELTNKDTLDSGISSPGVLGSTYPSGTENLVQPLVIVQLINEDLSTFHPKIAYGHEYSWRVRVQDDKGDWSIWVDGPDFTVPEDYPNASFVMDPTEPKISEEITFTDTSTQGSSPINVWSWDFGDLSPATSTQNPFYIYYEVEPITVELTITDSDPSGGRSCSTSTLFNVRPGKPEYIEVIPR